MEIINIYYRFEKLNPEKSKSRFDLVFNSEVYEPLNNPNPKGQVFIYYGINPHIKANGSRKGSHTISVRSKHLTSVFIPEIEKPNLAYGDQSEDAILIILSDKIIELFICKGKKSLLQNLYNLLYDGELDTEIEAFRKRVGQTLVNVKELPKEVSL